MSRSAWVPEEISRDSGRPSSHSATMTRSPEAITAGTANRGCPANALAKAAWDFASSP